MKNYKALLVSFPSHRVEIDIEADTDDEAYKIAKSEAGDDYKVVNIWEVAFK